MSTTMAPAAPATTDNVPPARTGGDTFASDPALVEAVRREGGEWALSECSELGQRCSTLLASGAPDESQARAFIGLAARTLQASLLVRFAPPAVADAFCASRLAPRFSGSYGDLPPGIDAAAIVERALPDTDRPLHDRTEVGR